MEASEASGAMVRGETVIGRVGLAAVGFAVSMLAVAGAARAQPAAIPHIESGQSPWARGVSRADREEAQRLFLEGTALMQQTLFAQAADKYEQALARWDLPAIHYNLALARFNLALDREALSSLKKAMQHGEVALGAARFRDAEKLEGQIERRLARIVITCDEPGARVSVDGEPVFDGPGTGEAVVAAGARVVVAEKTGFLAWTRTLAVSAGERVPLTIELVSAEPVRARRWTWWKPWAVAGAGAGLVLGGGVAHVLAARGFGGFDREFARLDCANEELIDAPPHVDGCRPDSVGGAHPARLARAERERVAAIGLYALGGTALVTGLVLAYLNRERIVPFEDPGEPPAPGGSRPEVSATMIPRGIGVSLRFDF